jgi:myo-inositol 2-dehydrogenase/D-chiro-inositol 1-dehydrogenase
VAFQVAYWRRFVPAMVALRERVLAGELGQILHLVCAQWDGAPPPVQFRCSSGGAFVDMGVHEFDVVRWLTGHP